MRISLAWSPTVLSVLFATYGAACDGGTSNPGIDGGPRPGTDSGPLIGPDGEVLPRDSGGGFRVDGCVPSVEICGDRIDQNCNGRDSSCGDNDGDHVQACRAGGDLSMCDCDDDHATAYPGRPEMECDGLDNDCNGRIDENAACCAGCAGVAAGTADICLEDGTCDCGAEPGLGPCTGGLTCCSAGCTDVTTDITNCGFCGTSCTTQADRCSAGHCSCGMSGPCDYIYVCTAGACGM